MLYKQSPGLRLIVSYADPEQNHNGGIYQAANWIYCGMTKGGTSQTIMPNGDRVHKKSLTSKYGTSAASFFGGTSSGALDKHKYLYPLDPAMRAQIEPLRKPYPKRVPRGSGEIDNAASTNSQTGGASPTDPLLSIEHGTF